MGDPKEKVCEVVEELHADLLVMGSRTFGPIKRYISCLGMRSIDGFNYVVRGCFIKAVAFKLF